MGLFCAKLVALAWSPASPGGSSSLRRCAAPLPGGSEDPRTQNYAATRADLCSATAATSQRVAGLQQSLSQRQQRCSGCAGLPTRCRRRRPDKRRREAATAVMQPQPRHGERPAYCRASRNGNGGALGARVFRPAAAEGGQTSAAAKRRPLSCNRSHVTANGRPTAEPLATATAVLWVRGSSDPLPPKAARQTPPRSGDRYRYPIAFRRSISWCVRSTSVPPTVSTGRHASR